MKKYTIYIGITNKSKIKNKNKFGARQRAEKFGGIFVQSGNPAKTMGGGVFSRKFSKNPRSRRKSPNLRHGAKPLRF